MPLISQTSSKMGVMRGNWSLAEPVDSLGGEPFLESVEALCTCGGEESEWKDKDKDDQHKLYFSYARVSAAFA